jgi:hypothetical protein
VLLLLQVRVYLARSCQGSDRSRYLQAVQAAFKRAVQARFGSSTHICCYNDDSSSSTARLDPWQQQQQRCGFIVQPAAAPAGPGVQQHVLQVAAGVVSWPQSPQQQRQQQQWLQRVLANDDGPMSGSEEGEGESRDATGKQQQQQGSSLHDALRLRGHGHQRVELQCIPSQQQQQQ